MLSKTTLKSVFVKALPWVVSVLLAAIIISPKPIADAEKPTLDAASYTAHAFTLGLDADLDYENEPYDRNGYFNSRTGLPSHPIGPGVLAAPFVAVFSIVDRFLGHPVISDHNEYIFSWSRFGLFISGVVYFLLGLLLYRDLGRRLAPRLHPIFILLPGLGSGVVYYVYHDGYLGHSFQFFSLALVVWASAVSWLRIAAGKPASAYMFLCTFSVALTHLIRPADVNVVLLPILTASVISVFHRPGDNISAVWKTFLSRYLVALILALSALALLYVFLYGTPFPLPSDMYGSKGNVKAVSALNSSADGASTLGAAVSLISTVIQRVSYIPAIIFSSEFGVFFTNPIVVLGLAILVVSLLIAALKRVTESAFAMAVVIAYIAVPVAVVLYWQTTASAYGWRYLFSLIGVGYIGLIATHVFWANKKHARILYSGFLGMLLVLSVVGVLSQAFWGTSSRLHFHIGKNVFGKYHGTKYAEYPCCSGLGYLTKLSEDVMKPGAWVAMAAHRFPGYVVAVGLEAANVDLVAFGTRFGVPIDKLEAGSKRYGDLPKSASIQIVLVFLVTVVGIRYLGFARSDGDARSGRRERVRDGLAAAEG